MLVIDHVLRNVSDTKPLGLMMAESNAVAELVQDYNTLVNDSAKPHNGEERLIAKGDMFGSDLKLYIAMMTAFEQMRLLTRYLSVLSQEPGAVLLTPTVEKAEKEESDEEAEPELDAVEEREHNRFKRGVFKGLIFGGLSILLILFGVMVAMLVYSHKAPDNPLIKTVMETAVELIKILLGATTSK